MIAGAGTAKELVRNGASEPGFEVAGSGGRNQRAQEKIAAANAS